MLSVLGLVPRNRRAAHEMSFNWERYQLELFGTSGPKAAVTAAGSGSKSKPRPDRRCDQVDVVQAIEALQCTLYCNLSTELDPERPGKYAMKWQKNRVWALAEWVSEMLEHRHTLTLPEELAPFDTDAAETDAPLKWLTQLVSLIDTWTVKLLLRYLGNNDRLSKIKDATGEMTRFLVVLKIQNDFRSNSWAGRSDREVCNSILNLIIDMDPNRICGPSAADHLRDQKYCFTRLQDNFNGLGRVIEFMEGVDSVVVYKALIQAMEVKGWSYLHDSVDAYLSLYIVVALFNPCDNRQMPEGLLELSSKSARKPCVREAVQKILGHHRTWILAAPIRNRLRLSSELE